jgi:hypothetical protein
VRQKGVPSGFLKRCRGQRDAKAEQDRPDGAFDEMARGGDEAARGFRREREGDQYEPDEMRERHEGAVTELGEQGRIDADDLREERDDEQRRFRIQRVGQEPMRSAAKSESGAVSEASAVASIFLAFSIVMPR